MRKVLYFVIVLMLFTDCKKRESSYQNFVYQEEDYSGEEVESLRSEYEELEIVKNDLENEKEELENEKEELENEIVELHQKLEDISYCARYALMCLDDDLYDVEMALIKIQNDCVY